MNTFICAMKWFYEKNKMVFFASRGSSVLRGLLVLIFTFFIMVDLFYSPVAEPEEPKVNSIVNIAAERVLDDNLQKLKDLDQSNWKKLSIDKKLEVLQTVANVEQNYLGLEQDLKVHAEELEKNVYAYYQPSTKSVHINIKRLKYAKASELMDSIAHESFHAYQHRMVDMYNSAGAAEKKLLYFKKLEKYDSEMRNYNNGSSDFKAYYNQSLEVDARSYARERTAYYVKRLDLKK